MDHCGFLILPEFLSNPAAVLGPMNPPSSSAETLLLLDLQILDGATIPKKILKKIKKKPKINLEFTLKIHLGFLGKKSQTTFLP